MQQSEERMCAPSRHEAEVCEGMNQPGGSLNQQCSPPLSVYIARAGSLFIALPLDTCGSRNKHEQEAKDS